nr:heme-binding protein [Nocardia spumae]
MFQARRVRKSGNGVRASRDAHRTTQSPAFGTNPVAGRDRRQHSAPLRRRLHPFAGGVLVTEYGMILGAAGASGAHATQDEEAVRTAVDRRHDDRAHSA